MGAIHQRCRAIRDRVYPVEQWPSYIYQQALAQGGGRLLEIGCGREARVLRRVAPHYESAVGLDPEIDGEHTPADGLRLVRGDAHALPFTSASFDVVAMQHVVEHLRDPLRAFAECARVLRPGGVLVVHTVNQHFPPILAGRALPHRLRQTLNRWCTGTADEDTFPAYYRANTARRLCAAAAASGLALRELRRLSAHPQYLMFSVWAYRAGVLVERALARVEALRGLRHYLFARFVKPARVGTRMTRPARRPGCEDRAPARAPTGAAGH